MDDRYCHTSSIVVKVPVARAFRIMADGLEQGRWTLGSWNRRKEGDDLFVGTSVFDNQETWVRLLADEARGLVDYVVGRGPDAMRWRNSARVLDGAAFDYPAGTSLITLMSWRLGAQSQESWDQLATSHETEMFMIKQMLEAAPR